MLPALLTIGLFIRGAFAGAVAAEGAEAVFPELCDIARNLAFISGLGGLLR